MEVIQSPPCLSYIGAYRFKYIAEPNSHGCQFKAKEDPPIRKTAKPVTAKSPAAIKFFNWPSDPSTRLLVSGVFTIILQRQRAGLYLPQGKYKHVKQVNILNGDLKID